LSVQLINLSATLVETPCLFDQYYKPLTAIIFITHMVKNTPKNRNATFAS